VDYFSYGVLNDAPAPSLFTMIKDTVRYSASINVNFGATGSPTSSYHGILVDSCYLADAVMGDNIQWEPNYSDPYTTTWNRGYVISNTEMYRAGENAIDMKGSQDIAIENCRFQGSFSDDNGGIANPYCGTDTTQGSHDEGSGSVITAGSGSTATEYFLVRRNVFWDGHHGVDAQWTSAMDGSRVFNNTFVNNTRTWEGSNRSSTDGFGAITARANAAVFNNIVVSMRGGSLVWYQASAGKKMDNNIYYESSGSPKFTVRTGGDSYYYSWATYLAAISGSGRTGNEAHSSYANPVFASGTPLYPTGENSAYTFDLDAGSPAIDAGTAMATTATYGSGVSVLTVSDPYVFRNTYGNSYCPYDSVYISGAGAVAVTSIDYGASTITISPAMTLPSGTKDIYLWPMYGSGPDIGAREKP
jgi:hypothetical protein